MSKYLTPYRVTMSDELSAPGTYTAILFADHPAKALSWVHPSVKVHNVSIDDSLKGSKVEHYRVSYSKGGNFVMHDVAVPSKVHALRLIPFGEDMWEVAEFDEQTGKVRVVLADGKGRKPEKAKHIQTYIDALGHDNKITKASITWPDDAFLFTPRGDAIPNSVYSEIAQRMAQRNRNNIRDAIDKYFRFNDGVKRAVNPVADKLRKLADAIESGAEIEDSFVSRSHKKGGWTDIEIRLEFRDADDKVAKGL